MIVNTRASASAFALFCVSIGRLGFHAVLLVELSLVRFETSSPLFKFSLLLLADA